MCLLLMLFHFCRHISRQPNDNILIYAAGRKNLNKLETQSWYISQINSVATLHPVLAASALILKAPEANA